MYEYIPIPVTPTNAADTRARRTVSLLRRMTPTHFLRVLRTGCSLLFEIAECEFQRGNRSRTIDFEFGGISLVLMTLPRLSP